MRTNFSNRFRALCFVFILESLFLLNLILPDKEFSNTERRKLTVLPSFSFESLFNGKLFEEFDQYAMDQFIGRDFFREIKAMGSYYLFKQMDNNDLYIIDGNISKMVYPLNEKSILNAANKLNEVTERYLKDKNVYYAVIPDKNYFLAKENSYLSMDYERLMNILQENIKGMHYIDLFDSLTIDDYYRTDIHWRQEKLLGIAGEILYEMGKSVQISDHQYQTKELFPFYGALYGQAAIKVEPDTLLYLTNPELEQHIVYDYELKSKTNVYAPEKFEGTDPYDVFLSGAKPLLKIIKKQSNSDQRLILFRDSFGSSIAPLLMEGYAEVTLIDLRYISSAVLEDYINFSEYHDILFLYNTQILNNSFLLK